jgi:hypothetical protein
MKTARLLIGALLIGFFINGCANIPGKPCQTDGYNYCLAREGWNN